MALSLEASQNGYIKMGDMITAPPKSIIFHCDRVMVWNNNHIELTTNENGYYGNLTDFETITFNVVGKKTTYKKQVE